MSAGVRAGYKQTDVGVIPEDWTIRKLEEVFSLKSGFAFSSEFFSKVGPIVLTPGNFHLDGGLYFEARNTKHFGGAYSPKMTFSRGDLLIVMTDLTPDCNLLGKPAVVEMDELILHNQRIGKVVFKNGNVDVSFLYYTLLSKPYLSHIKEQAVGSTVRHTSTRSICSVQLPWPPLAEQRAIATALSDVDALLSGLDSLIAKKQNLKQAAMQQLLTGQTRLPGFSGEWEVKRLGEVGEIASAGVDKKIQPDELPVRLVNYLDVYRRDFIYSKDLNHWVTAPEQQARRCAVKKGDVFFTPTSETRDDIGLTAVAMEDIPDAAYSYHVARLRLHEPWDLRFRTYVFKTRAFLDQAETLCDGNGTRYVVSQGKFRAMTVHVPPILEQTAIASVLSDMDTELAALQARRDKTRALKQGMMQELLTGRIRLV